MGAAKVRCLSPSAGGGCKALGRGFGRRLPVDKTPPIALDSSVTGGTMPHAPMVNARLAGLHARTLLGVHTIPRNLDTPNRKSDPGDTCQRTVFADGK